MAIPLGIVFVDRVRRDGLGDGLALTGQSLGVTAVVVLLALAVWMPADRRVLAEPWALTWVTNEAADSIGRDV